MKHRTCSVLSILFLTFSLTAPASTQSTDPSEVCRPGKWLDVDCRPSAGECYNSCPTHNYCAVKDENKCPRPASYSADVACYCYLGSAE